MQKERKYGKKGRVAEMGTLAAGIIVAGIVGIAVRSMIHDKKNGKSLQCGKDCSKCGGCGK